MRELEVEVEPGAEELDNIVSIHKIAVCEIIGSRNIPLSPRRATSFLAVIEIHLEL